MAPSRRVLRSAIVMMMSLGALAGALPAAAQQYESSLRSLDYSPDPLARSPRLLGMGQLTLADDLHNRIGLWDFAGNPTGIAEAELPRAADLARQLCAPLTGGKLASPID